MTKLNNNFTTKYVTRGYTDDQAIYYKGELIATASFWSNIEMHSENTVRIDTPTRDGFDRIVINKYGEMV